MQPKNIIKIALIVIAVWLASVVINETFSNYVDSNYDYVDSTEHADPEYANEGVSGDYTLGEVEGQENDEIAEEDANLSEEDVFAPEEDALMPEEDVLTPEEEALMPEEEVLAPEEQSPILRADKPIEVMIVATPENGTSIAPTEVLPGEEIVYTMTVINVGDETVNSIHFIEEISSYVDIDHDNVTGFFGGLDYYINVPMPLSDIYRVTRVGTPTRFSLGLGAVEWNIDLLHPNEFLTVTFVVRVHDEVPVGTVIESFLGRQIFGERVGLAYHIVGEAEEYEAEEYEDEEYESDEYEFSEEDTSEYETAEDEPGEHESGEYESNEYESAEDETAERETELIEEEDEDLFGFENEYALTDDTTPVEMLLTFRSPPIVALDVHYDIPVDEATRMVEEDHTLFLSEIEALFSAEGAGYGLSFEITAMLRDLHNGAYITAPSNLVRAILAFESVIRIDRHILPELPSQPGPPPQTPQTPALAITMDSDPVSGTADAPTLMLAGSEIVYTVRVTNTSNEIVEDISVIEHSSRYLDPQEARIMAHFGDAVAQPIFASDHALSDRVDFSFASSVSVSDSTQVERSTQTLHWDIDSLEPGETFTVIIPTTITGDVPAGTEIRNNATTTYGDYERIDEFIARRSMASSEKTYHEVEEGFIEEPDDEFSDEQPNDDYEEIPIEEPNDDYEEAPIEEPNDDNDESNEDNEEPNDDNDESNEGTEEPIIDITTVANPASGTAQEPTLVLGGSEIAFTMTVTNMGDETATAIRFTEEISSYLWRNSWTGHFGDDAATPVFDLDRISTPYAVDYLPPSADPQLPTATYIWGIDYLEPGETFTMTITATVLDDVAEGTVMQGVLGLRSDRTFHEVTNDDSLIDDDLIVEPEDFPQAEEDESLPDKEEDSPVEEEEDSSVGDEGEDSPAEEEEDPSAEEEDSSVEEEEVVIILPPTVNVVSTKNYDTVIGDEIEFTLTINNPNDFDIFDHQIIKAIPDYLAFVQDSVEVVMQKEISLLRRMISNDRRQVDVVTEYTNKEVKVKFPILSAGNTYLIRFLATLSDTPTEEERDGGNSRPPNQGGNNNNRPPNQEGNRPPNQGGNNNNRPPNQEGGNRPPNQGGNNNNRPPNPEGGNRPPNQGGNNNNRPPNQEGGNRPPNQGGNNNNRPPNPEGGNRPPNQGGNNNNRPPNQEGGNRPPNNQGGNNRPPNQEGGNRPPNREGQPPPPNQGGGQPAPPPNQGGGRPAPAPNQGGGRPAPAPNQGGGRQAPPPNQGGGRQAPAPNQGGGRQAPPPNQGGGRPAPAPNQGGGHPAPAPNQGGGHPAPAPNQGGGHPAPAPNQGGGHPAPPPAEQLPIEGEEGVASPGAPNPSVLPQTGTIVGISAVVSGSALLTSGLVLASKKKKGKAESLLTEEELGQKYDREYSEIFHDSKK